MENITAIFKKKRGNHALKRGHICRPDNNGIFVSQRSMTKRKSTVRSNKEGSPK